MATVEAGKELIWMREFLSELGMKQEKYYMAKKATYHSRTKHIQRRYHWLRERVEENESDMLTKILSMEKLVVCRKKIGLVDSPLTGVKGEFVM